MTEEEQTKLLYEIFDPSLPRLAPGDEASTGRALDVALQTLGTSNGLKVLDLGCGNGASTLELARRGVGSITAVDNYGPFLGELGQRAASTGVGECITTLEADMSSLPLEAEGYDLIWSEGSLYSMGVEAGLRYYRSGLKAGGVFSMSELCWLKEDVPEACRAFWASEYPAMGNISSNREVMESCGYTVLESFVLPVSAWWLGYYLPLEGHLATLQEKYGGDEEQMGALAMVEKEIAICREYSDYYGYVFYILQKE